MGRARKSEKRKHFSIRMYGEEVDKFMDLATHFGCNSKAMGYLMQVEKLYTELKGHTGTPKSDAKEFYKSVGEELCQEDDEGNSLKLYFPFEQATWERYNMFCRKTCPLWVCKTHNEKITMILQMAEKYYASMSCQKGQTREDSSADADNDQETGFIRYSDAIPSTPERATVPKTRNPPPAPRKERKDQEISDKTPGKGDTRKSNHQQHAQRREHEDQQVSPRPEKRLANHEGGHGQTSVVTSPEKPLVIEQVRSLQGIRLIGADQTAQNTLTVFFQQEDVVRKTSTGQQEPPVQPPVGNPATQKRSRNGNLEGADPSSRKECPGPSGAVRKQTHLADSNLMLEVGMESSLWGVYTNFFNRHGWSMKTVTEKVVILLEIAENRLKISQITDIESRRSRIEKVISEWKSWPSHHGSTEFVSVLDNSLKCTPMESMFTLNIPMTDPLWKRYHKFFDSMKPRQQSNYERFKILLSMAEASLDLGYITSCTGNSFLEVYRVPESWASDDKRQGDSSKETSYQPGSTPFLLWLSPPVKKSYREFFEKHNLTSKTDDEKVLALLKMAETPRKTASGSEPVDEDLCETQQVAAEIIAQLIREDDCESTASDGTWDDGVETDKQRVDDQLGLEEDTQAQSDQRKPKAALRLLKPNYYLKFSEKARQLKKDKRSKRTVAAMANTRKHIVERHQLKQLIAQCTCSYSWCKNTIDRKSIVIKDFAWTIVVSAHCQGDQKHKFKWASSARAPSFKNKKNNVILYTLNTAIPAAVQLSGNNIGKLEHFARVLQLTWGKDRVLRPTVNACKQIVRKCFETTREEMLENLIKETGDIVLAGDGQFDSPGSCATVCTYTLMALGVDEEQDDGSRLLKRCEYVINQALIDKRHADNKSVNMERIGLHWALQPIIKAGIKVSELATDDHTQITADFRKIAAAMDERKNNARTGNNDQTALRAFKDSLSTALLHYQPPVDVPAEVKPLLAFYARIVHSNDIWHRAKNLLKTVSTIAQGAPSKEQQTYRRYAKMLRNYIWECAKQAQGKQEKFLSLWCTAENHLQDKHAYCSADFHAKTKLMGKLDQTTRSFGLLIRCLQRVEASAPQLCRFRNTGILEAYNGLTLKYCPKRIHLTYDSMMLRRDLAALDHNHHVLRSARRKKNGEIAEITVWKKSTKAFTTAVKKEVKDYKYIGHIMAAILAARCEGEYTYDTPSSLSAAHPWRIHGSLALAAGAIDPKHPGSNRHAQWLAKQTAPNIPNPIKPAAAKKKSRKRKDSSSSADTPSESSESEEEDDSGPGTSRKRAVKPKNRKRRSSDDEWRPKKSSGATAKRKKRNSHDHLEEMAGGKRKKAIVQTEEAEMPETEGQDELVGQSDDHGEPVLQNSGFQEMQNREESAGADKAETEKRGTEENRSDQRKRGVRELVVYVSDQEDLLVEAREEPVLAGQIQGDEPSVQHEQQQMIGREEEQGELDDEPDLAGGIQGTEPAVLQLGAQQEQNMPNHDQQEMIGDEEETGEWEEHEEDDQEELEESGNEDGLHILDTESVSDAGSDNF